MKQNSVVGKSIIHVTSEGENIHLYLEDSACVVIDLQDKEILFQELKQEIDSNICDLPAELRLDGKSIKEIVSFDDGFSEIRFSDGSFVQVDFEENAIKRYVSLDGWMIQVPFVAQCNFLQEGTFIQDDDVPTNDFVFRRAHSLGADMPVLLYCARASRTKETQ